MKKWVAAAIALTTVMFLGTVLYERSLEKSDPEGLRNLKRCFSLKPGVTADDLSRALGPPERTERRGATEEWFFHTHRSAARPISAEVDPATRAVLTLRCRDDEKPTWTVRR